MLSRDKPPCVVAAALWRTSACIRGALRACASVGLPFEHVFPLMTMGAPVLVFMPRQRCAASSPVIEGVTLKMRKKE